MGDYARHMWEAHFLGPDEDMTDSISECTQNVPDNVADSDIDDYTCDHIMPELEDDCGCRINPDKLDKTSGEEDRASLTESSVGPDGSPAETRRFQGSVPPQPTRQTSTNPPHLGANCGENPHFPASESPFERTWKCCSAISGDWGVTEEVVSLADAEEQAGIYQETIRRLERIRQDAEKARDQYRSRARYMEQEEDKAWNEAADAEKERDQERAARERAEAERDEAWRIEQLSHERAVVAERRFEELKLESPENCQWREKFDELAVAVRGHRDSDSVGAFRESAALYATLDRLDEEGSE